MIKDGIKNIIKNQKRLLQNGDIGELAETIAFYNKQLKKLDEKNEVFQSYIRSYENDVANNKVNEKSIEKNCNIMALYTKYIDELEDCLCCILISEGVIIKDDESAVHDFANKAIAHRLGILYKRQNRKLLSKFQKAKAKAKRMKLPPL